ncbi:hypothetical protein E4U40_005311 [Claviceps sp. LM458 group G5]|nr:hypothetical protein E4U40_005311 [Claviceps sp. LM458 group G5]
MLVRCCNKSETDKNDSHHFEWVHMGYSGDHRPSNDHDESGCDGAPLGPPRGASPVDSESFLGENLPQNVVALGNRLPGVAAQDIDDVRTGKLDFLNLIRLHPSLGQRPSDNDGTSVVDISGGTIVHRKKTHTLKDYPGPLVFMHCFQRYIWIYDKFHRKEHPDMASAQLGFGIFVIHKAEMFPWDKCLRFAMDRLNHIRVSNVHDATLWEERPLDWIHQHFSYVGGEEQAIAIKSIRDSCGHKTDNTSDTTGPMPCPGVPCGGICRRSRCIFGNNC